MTDPDGFLAGPDPDGIDALALEIESLSIWLDVARDPTYDIAVASMTWRECAAQLAERAIVLGRLLVATR